MARTFDLSRLFVADRWRRDPALVPYRTLAAELDAVRAGKKGMSQFGFLAGDMLAGDPEYREVLELALRRGLVVVLRNDWLDELTLARQDTAVYVTRPEELWRIPAWITLWTTALAAGGWSDAAEEQASALLGYDAAQRARWRRHLRQRWAAWGATNVYALVTAAHRRRIAALGGRCLGDAAEVAGLTVHLHRERNALRPDAHRLVPRGATLARFGVRRGAVHRLFGEPRGWPRGPVLSAVVPGAAVAELNAALASPVQYLTARGWR